MATSRGPLDNRTAIRVSATDRELVARAAASTGKSASHFARDVLRVSAQRTLADRTEFVLSPEETVLWEFINAQPAEPSAYLTAFMNRPSPFVD